MESSETDAGPKMSGGGVRQRVVLRGERRTMLVVLLVLFGVISLVAHRFGGGRAGGLTPVRERRAMPDLVLQQVGGGEWKLLDFRGKVVLVNFWATWCGPCLEETPTLVKGAEEMGPQGLAVMGVSLDAGGATAENLGKIGSFMQRYGVKYPITFPAAGSQMEFGVEGIPTSILVDREGRVAKLYVGAVGPEVLQRDVGELLKER